MEFIQDTVKPLDKGHIGTSHCILDREVVLFSQALPLSEVLYNRTSDTLGTVIIEGS